jgi:hypothetical protein
MGSVDARLRLAVDASRAWYDDVFALHGLPAACDGVLWRALADPPPYHSVAKTLQRRVPESAVRAAVRGPGSFADSFADVELPGFTVLFEAMWVHHSGGTRTGFPTGWSIITTPEELALWVRRHHYVGVLTCAVLDWPAFTILGRFDGANLIGGAVLHERSGAVGLSNMWTLPEHPMDWNEVLAAVSAVHPGKPVTGYASGEDLNGLLHGGFRTVGAQRVWVR